jgi:hypothetical protein
VTFKDLQKLVQSESGHNQSQLLHRLGNKPFWIWDQKQHKQTEIKTKGDCCFNHIIGLPQKDSQDMPLLAYQRTLYNSLQNHKHIWIKKSRGIGVTEFLLRYIAWSCFSEYTTNSRVCIVTGPRIDLAEDLIARFKGLFKENFAQNDRTASTVAIINSVKVEAFPSHHVDTMRGLDNVKLILSDETDYYPPFQQKEVRAVTEGYIGKPNSDPHIVLVSTPKAPGGLMQQIELEQDSLYHKLFFDYTYGLEGPYPIYSLDQIEKAKQSPEFEREYNLKYLGLIGNVFHTKDIEAAIEKGKNYNPDIVNSYSQKSVGLDPAWGSSAFGVVVTQWVDNQIQIITADEYERPDFDDMIDITLDICHRFGISLRNGCQIFVDGANAEFIRSLKKQLGNNPNYEEEIDRIKKDFPGCDWTQNMLVVPVHFSKEHKQMLTHTKKLMEYNDGMVAINPKYDKLITSLRTAVDKGEGNLDKEAISYDDVLDAFRLALKFYQ